MDIYQVAIRPLLFNLLKADPERLHSTTIRSLKWLSQTSNNPPASWINHRLQQSLCLQDARLEQNLFGLNFPNPLGLAAGFDKDGVAAPIWSSLGFGFAELGTVTYHPQPGNPRPRLFRLPLDKAALNRMGFNNSGAAVMAKLLAESQQNLISIPIGINLGKSQVTPLEEAAIDYLNSFRLLKDCGDYFVVNVSSPNTPGLRSLQDRGMLSSILDLLQKENTAQKPLFVKIAPDLEWEAIADIISLSQAYHLAGIIATNTTIRRDRLKTLVIEQTGKSVQEEAGGISRERGLGMTLGKQEHERSALEVGLTVDEEHRHVPVRVQRPVRRSVLLALVEGDLLELVRDPQLEEGLVHHHRGGAG